MPDNFYFRYGKRLFDLAISILSTIILSPVFAIIALLIKLDDGGPVVFIQKRIGQNFQSINIIKFRTMIKNADQKGLQVTKKADPRITTIGKYLRRLKLDELPQFFNVIRGDISVVGPRPEVEKYVMIFREEYERILLVKPGITDFAALYYRDEQDILDSYQDTNQAYIEKIMPEKIKLYHKYIKEISFLTDLKIIADTARSMIQ